MSKNDVLYCKGMNMELSESDDPQSHSDKWDDSLLNNAYDRALKLANVEVAKRLAMATNSSPSSQKKKQVKRKQWSAGMPCRAVYEEDGIEYEAFVVKIVNDRDCVVKFLGYDNSQQVALNSLRPSGGKDAQQRQIEQAVLDREDESDDSASVTDDMKSERKQSTMKTEGHKKRNPKKKNRHPQPNHFHLPEIPLPDMDKLRNMTSMDIPFPMPPPPPLQLPSRSNLESEDSAVSSMLLAWYMSGYYTGLYQGLKRSKFNKRQRD